MDILHVSGDTYIVPGATVIGVYIHNNSAYLIDTGLDENQIRKVYNLLNEKGISIIGVINTHSHADHTGGNKFLEKKGVTNFYASQIEGFFIKNPIMLTSFMYGSFPPEFMKIKLLMPEPVKEVREIFPELFRIEQLPGHSWGMIGIFTPDNVFFCADSLYSENIVEKHPLLFHLNTGDFINTMMKIENFNPDYFVLSHGGVTRKITFTVKKNIYSLENIMSIIIENSPGYADEIFYRVLEKIGIKNEWEYYLNRVPFQSMLTYLYSIGEIKISISNGKLILEKH